MQSAEVAPIEEKPARPAPVGWSRALSKRALQGFWGFLMPAVLTAAVLRYLVPPAGTGAAGWVAVLGHRYALLFTLGVFLLFSGLAHYWRHHLPGARMAWESPGAATPEPAGSRRREMVRLAAMVLASAVAAVAVRAFVRPYRVLSASMLPTFEADDVIGGRMLTTARSGGQLPARGDVVVFRGAAVAPPGAGATWPDVLVKRVIGLPGDRVAMRGGAPVINGWQVPTCDAGEYVYMTPDTTGRGLHGRLRVEFLGGRAYLTVHALGAAFSATYTVKPGEVFVLGDNRSNSMDSRSYNNGQGGGVPLDALEARVGSFLVGTHRSGDMDLGRFLRPIDGLQVHLRLEGVQTQSLDEGIARCLRDRPSDTSPPAAEDLRKSEASF